MWFVKYGDEFLHDPRVGLTLQSSNPTAELNTSTLFTFEITTTHPLYETIREYDPDNPVIVYQDDTIIYKGEIIEIDDDFQLTKTVTCKSDLGYFNHSIVRPYSTLSDECDRTCPTTVNGYFEFLVTEHNNQASESRKFKMGTNDGASLDSNNYIYRSDSTYPTVGSVISEKIIDDLGGYLRVRYEDDGTYIDLLSDMPNVNSQVIDFGKNLLDYTKTEASDDLATFVIPRGKQIENDSETEADKLTTYLLISSQAVTDLTKEKGFRQQEYDDAETSLNEANANKTEVDADSNSTDEQKKAAKERVDNAQATFDDAKEALESAKSALEDAEKNQYDTAVADGYLKRGDIIYSEAAVKKYGWIGTTVDYEDVTLVSTLMKYGYIYLKSVESPVRTIEIKAIDLSMLDPDLKPIRVGDYIRVRSKPHSFDSYMLCTKIEYDLNNPENNTFTLGTTFDTLTGQQNTRINKLNADINTVYEAAAKISDEAKASALIAGEAQEAAQSAKRTANEAKDSVPEINISKTDETVTVSVTQRGETTTETISGARGYSAYELAKAGGYSGTETEWLESLRGANGVSPTVTVTKSETSTTITINNADGSTTSETVEDGAAGTPGTNGYVHVKYSDDGTSFTENDGETPGDYIGVYTDNTEEDSLAFDKYTWTKIKGDNGDEGYSPEVAVERNDNGCTITVTDKNGTTSETVFDGDISEAVNQAVAAAENKVEEETESILGSVDTKLEKYATVEYTDGQITQKVEEVETATKSYTDSKVVGRNLLVLNKSNRYNGPATTHGVTVSAPDSEGWFTVSGTTTGGGTVGVFTLWGKGVDAANEYLPAEGGEYQLTVEYTDGTFISGTTYTNSSHIALYYNSNNRRVGGFTDDTVHVSCSDYIYRVAYYIGIDVPNGTVIDGKFRLKLEKGNKSTEWTIAPEDTEYEIRRMSTEITQSAEEIRMDFNSSIASVSSGLKSQIQDNDALVNKKLGEFNKYIRFVDGKIVLGESGNELMLTIQNNRVSFTQSGVEVAYFSNNNLYIKRAEVLTTLKVGNYEFAPRNDGGLALRRRSE